MDELKSDVKQIREDVTDIKVILAQNTTILAEHERRSTNLEARTGTLEKWMYGILGMVALITFGIQIYQLVH